MASQFVQILPPRRVIVILMTSLLTGNLLGYMDQTIMSTAGPTIILFLGGLEVYAWVFGAYILAQTISMPLFGRLADIYGRKKFFMIGLVIFMTGSALSGLSQNIDELIVFRALQGVGSGAFFPLALAIIGLVFPPRSRGSVQVLISSISIVSTVIGPAVGSYLVQALDWRWIFYINLPFGAISLSLMKIGFDDSMHRDKRHGVDWPGSFALVTSVAALMLGFLFGGTTFSWYSWQEFSLFSLSIVFFILLVFIEMRAAEPILPLSLFKSRIVSASGIVFFLRGISYYATIAFVPLLVQAALGGSINDSRNVIYAFLFPIVVGNLLGGVLGTRVGYRRLIPVGMFFTVIGLFALSSIDAQTSLTELIGATAFVGLGAGISYPVLIYSVQYSTSAERIGVASSFGQFLNNLGGTLGLTILGVLQIRGFTGWLSNYSRTLPGSSSDELTRFLADPNFLGQFLAQPEALIDLLQRHPTLVPLLPTIREGFAMSISPIFLTAAITSSGALIASLFIRGSLKEQVDYQILLHRKIERSNMLDPT